MAHIDTLFKILKEKKGSDLHLSPENSPLMLAAGDLVPVMAQKLNHEQHKALLYEIMNERQRTRSIGSSTSSRPTSRSRSGP